MWLPNYGIYFFCASFYIYLCFFFKYILLCIFLDLIVLLSRKIIRSLFTKTGVAPIVAGEMPSKILQTLRPQLWFCFNWLFWQNVLQVEPAFLAENFFAGVLPAFNLCGVHTHYLLLLYYFKVKWITLGLLIRGTPSYLFSPKIRPPSRLLGPPCSLFSYLKEKKSENRTTLFYDLLEFFSRKYEF